METKAQQLGITDYPYHERDKDGNVTYVEYGDGVCHKWEHDGNETYYENSDGWVCKWKCNYSKIGDLVYLENGYDYKHKSTNIRYN